MGNSVPKCCKEEKSEIPSVATLEDEHAALSRRHNSPAGGVTDSPVPTVQRVRVHCDDASIVAKVPTTSLADFRTSVLQQLADSGIAMQRGSHIRYKDHEGNWLVLSPLALEDFSCQ